MATVLEVAALSSNIENALKLATKKSQLLQITDNVLYFLLTQCLSFASCDLVKKKGHLPHVFIVESRPHNLALALSTRSFRHNLINIYNGLSRRQMFRLKPPPITYMLLQALTLYEDCAGWLASNVNIQWEMPVKLYNMKVALESWHDTADHSAASISRVDVTGMMNKDGTGVGLWRIICQMDSLDQ